jgi:hypothetical protein
MFIGLKVFQMKSGAPIQATPGRVVGDTTGVPLSAKPIAGLILLGPTFAFK